MNIISKVYYSCLNDSGGTRPKFGAVRYILRGPFVTTKMHDTKCNAFASVRYLALVDNGSAILQYLPKDCP